MLAAQHIIGRLRYTPWEEWLRDQRVSYIDAQTRAAYRDSKVGQSMDIKTVIDKVGAYR